MQPRSSIRPSKPKTSSPLPPRFEELTQAVWQYTETHPGGNPFPTGIEDFAILRSDRVRTPTHRVFQPALCMTLQGAKWAAFGEKRMAYKAGQALVVSLELPSRGAVSAASPKKPFLGLVIGLDRAILRSVLEEIEPQHIPLPKKKPRGSFVVSVSAQLADCALRAVRLLETPQAIAPLYPGILREICYWLVTGPGGESFRYLLEGRNHDRRVIEAIHTLRSHFSEPIRVEDLATAAHMSAATFHRQFKQVTAMSPLQYQKQLRLLEARRRMIDGSTSVESAAFDVGYESASQFSREYSRMFGKPPRRDVSSFLAAEATSS